MKKNLFPLLVILLLAACQKESISPDISEGNKIIELRTQGNNVSICHNGNNIHINIDAVPAHQAHGDAVDMDGDTYFDLPNDCGSGVDCNDNDPNINPGAEEVCDDGTDNNCDGEIDEGCIQTVTICDQVWMVQNLDVSTYRNGDPIPQVTDDAIWKTLTTGAYCYYNNDSATYAAIYGKLYNWYAVGDSRGLAPEGWHIPTDIEWVTLADCLGGYGAAGGAMKETGTAHWSDPNTGATNISGFTALPGGYHGSNCCTNGVGFQGGWWSSTEFYYYPSAAWQFFLTTYNVGLFGNAEDKRFGHSVRCVQD